MGRISALSVLLFLSGTLLSGHYANGQTTEAIVSKGSTWTMDLTSEIGAVLTNGNTCTQYAEAGAALCKNYNGLQDLNVLLNSGNITNYCQHSLQEYACASAVKDRPATEIFNILSCFLTDSTAVTTNEGFASFFAQLSTDKLSAVFNLINTQVTSSSITPLNKEYILNGVIEALVEEPMNLLPGALATWFQEKLYTFLPAINTDMLDCLASTSISCDGLAAITSALDLQFSVLSNETQNEIAVFITRFVSSHSCSTGDVVNSINTYFKSFKSLLVVTDFSVAFGSSASIEASVLPSLTSAQMLQYVQSSSVFSSYDESFTAVLNILESQDFSYNYALLSSLTGEGFDINVMYKLLYNILEKLNTITDPTCKPKVDVIFKNLGYLFKGANETIFELYQPQDCSEFQAFFNAVDAVDDQLSEDVKISVYQNRLRFLNAETLRSGSGCTYGLSSVTWLQTNWGKSIHYVAYSEFIYLYSAFDGYEACEYLNTNQTLDLLIHTKILTEASPVNYTYRITAITQALTKKGFVELKLFLTQFRIILIQYNIRIIFNFQVRYMFLEGIWKIVKTQLSTFKSNDWYSWMHEYLAVFSSAFTSEQLSDLSIGVVKDCSTLQTITSGLNSGFGDMGDGTKSDCTDWLAKTIGDTETHCTDVQGDWLKANFFNFSQEVSMTVIQTLNPDYLQIAPLTTYTTTQLGELVVVSEEARTNVTYVKQVFDVLIDTESVKKSIVNLGFFWDSYVQVQTTTTVNISYEVQYEMLQQTCSQLGQVIVNFTADETSLWFENRLSSVLTTIDNEILKPDIPLTVDCSVQKVLVKAFSNVYEDTPHSNKEDVTNHLTDFLQYDEQHKTEANQCINKEESTLTYIEDYCGEYSAEFSYETIKSFFFNFDVFETGVLNRLTTTQIGDMLVVDQIYESDEKSIKFTSYLNTTTVESANAVMERFCATGIQKNIQITKESTGKTILASYLNTIKSSIQKYTITEIRYILQYRIVIIMQYFSIETLSIFVVEDCDTLVVIITELNKAYSKMSADTRSQVATWAITMLKKKSLGGCTTKYTTTTEYTTTLFQQFFQDTTLKAVSEVNTHLNVLEVMVNTSVSQKVEYLFSSTVLTNVSQTLTVVESLKPEVDVSLSQQVDSFLTVFNAEYSKSTEKTMSVEVREAAMTKLFSSYTSEIKTLSAEDVSLFSENFQYFLPGFTVDLTEEIPLDINCHTYNAIFSGINGVSSELTDDINSAVFQRMISYLNYNDASSSNVCSELYNDSRTYVKEVFAGMSTYATFSQLEKYNNNFNAYQCLDLFTGTQLGTLIINTTASSSILEAAQILVQVNTRSTKEVYQFVTEIHQVAQENNIQIDTSVQTLICQTVLPKVIEDVKTTGSYSAWFNGTLDILSSGFTAEDIQNIPVKKDDCDSQISVVQTFSKVYNNLDENQKGAMINRIKDFNEGFKKDKGHACPTPSGSSTEWVEKTYGQFSQNFSITELQQANDNFKPTEILTILTGSQLADVAIETGALKSEEAIKTVLVNVDTTTELSYFLDQCNTNAPEDLKNGPAASHICTKAFEVLKVDQLSDTDVTDWFQVKLKNVLHQVNSTDWDNVNFPLRCSAYQELVTGLDNAYDDMSDDTRRSVYDHCIHRQLSSSSGTNGVKCGKPTDNPQVWLNNNVGSFSKDGDVIDFSVWNPTLQATDVLSSLNPSQMAELTVQSINNEETACQVAARVQQFDSSSAGEFLDSFSSTLKTKNVEVTSVAVSSKILSASLSVFSGSLSTFTSTEWDNLVNVQLSSLFLGLNAEYLSTLLENADCATFFNIVSQVNNVFDKFSEDTQNSLFDVVNGYITKHQKTTGFCPQSGEDSAATVTKLGRFASYFTVAQLQTFNPSFTGLSALSKLSPAQVASVCNTDALYDESKATQVTSVLSGYTFIQLDGFLQAFTSTNNLISLPSATINIYLSTIFNIVAKQFSSFTDNQWSDYFRGYLNVYLSGITEGQIAQFPISLSCASLASVVAGLNKHYETYSGNVQRAIFVKIQSILINIKTSTGSPCVGSLNSAIWLDTYMGYFSEQASIDEIKGIYSAFSVVDSTSYLTASQLGYSMATLEVLADVKTVTTIMTSLNSQNIGAFLDSFNAQAKQNEITEISNAAVRNVMVTETFCKYGTSFSTFSASDWANLFSNKLYLLRSSLTTKAFSFLPSDLSCSILATIMAPLISYGDDMDVDSLYYFIKGQLLNQLQTTGSACTKDYDSRTWVLTLFGKPCFEAASWSDIATLYPTFDVSACADLMTSVQISQSTSSITVTRNVTTVVTMLQYIGTDLSGLSSFLDQFKAAVAMDSSLATNAKVCEAILDIVSMNVFSLFDTFSVSETQSWMDKISPLYPYLNATYLQDIPIGIQCPQLKAVCVGLQKAAASLSEKRKQSVSDFILQYLNYHLENDGTACTEGSATLGLWFSDFWGVYCKYIPSDKIIAINSAVNQVSYGNNCASS